MADLRHVTHLTFDCYGTLIDWEGGILRALGKVFGQHGLNMDSEAVLCSYVHHEARIEAGPWQPYRDILRNVAAAIGRDFRIELTLEECERLPGSLADWPPFPDTVAGLALLKDQFRLAVLSNIDEALFADTARQLKVSFDEVITAEQVQGYKPGEAHFREALRRLKVPAAQILHVASSIYHDHVPAQRLGFQTAWVRRTSRLPATGLALPAAATPDLVVPDLLQLIAVLKNSHPGLANPPTAELTGNHPKT